jgi:RND family efflux transporter MFP subunit
MKRNFKLAAGVLMVTAVMASCQNAEVKEEQEEKTKLPLVTTVQVERAPFAHEIRVQGNIETDLDVLISAEMGGMITGITVSEGQRVKKGQVLASIDASVLNSNLQELETSLEYAEYMLKKQEELNDKDVGSEVELEGSRNQVAALKAKIKSLNTQKGKATITAAFSGVIDQVYGKNGQIAGPQSPLFRLVNNETVDVVASVSEKHYANVQIGTAIEVSFPNYTDTTIKLKVTNVGNYIEPTNRTIRIRSTIKNNKFLLPNMLAEVSITDLNVDNGIVVPSKSILKDNENRDFVYVVVKGKKGSIINKRNVEVISRYAGQCLISDESEIKTGEMIVVGGARGVAQNDLVEIKK